MGDATDELLKALDDPARFERVAAVPVFRAHERHFPEVRLSNGEVRPARTVRVTEADLYAIANRLNASIASTGHLPPLLEGHRQFDAAFPEKHQPRVLGFARNYRVDWVVREESRFLALLEDEFVKVACRDALGQYPYRSLEYDSDGKIGEGTAMLVRPPFFKMGTTCLYQSPETTTMPNEQWSPADEQAFQTFCKYMQRYSSMGAMGPGNAAPPAPVGAPASPPPPPAGYSAPTASVMYVTVGPDGRVITPPVPGPIPAPYQAPAVPVVPPPPPAIPAAVPTTPPTSPAALPVNPVPYAGGTYYLAPDGRLVPTAAGFPAAQPAAPAPFNPATYATVAAELATVRQQLAVEQNARVTAECRQLLDPLVPVVTFDYSAELTRLTSMADPNARAAHLKYMADHYGRLPGGAMIPVYSGTAHMPQPQQPGDGPPAPKHYQATMAYMLAHPGMTYDQAESAILAAAK